MHDVGEMLRAWGNFYVLLGSAAGALTGLVFIVITLVSEERRARSETGISTFTTPTIVHFGCALFVSGVMSVPFDDVAPLAMVLGITGATGIAYIIRIGISARQLVTYKPDAEDWSWNVVLPLCAYVALLCGAAALPHVTRAALFVPAATVMLLILIGIHNAWDVVTFIALGKADELPDDPAAAETPHDAPADAAR